MIENISRTAGSISRTISDTFEPMSQKHPTMSNVLKTILMTLLVIGGVIFAIPFVLVLVISVVLGVCVKFVVEYLSFSMSVTSDIVRHSMIALVLFLVLIWVTFQILDVYTRHGDEFSIPNFSGMSIDEAANLVNKKNLRFQIIDSVFNPKKEGGTIVEQIPPAQFKVKENRTIFFIINARTAEKVRVPSLVGLSLIQAQADLENCGLNVGKLEYVPDIAKNCVLRQKYKGKAVAEGTMIPKGSNIDLVLGQGTEGGRTAVPYLIGLTRDIATQRTANAMLNIGATVFEVSVKTRRDSAIARIWKQNPAFTGDTIIEMGSYIDVWLTIEAEKAVPDSSKMDE